MFSLPHPETVINIVAGMVGMLFDRVQNGRQLDRTHLDEADDLTVISGIGPTFARRLNEAGILTYAQLAKLDAEKVVEITHVAGWQADPSKWISQAQALA